MSTYDQDVIKWSEEQAKFLLAGDFEQLDLTNLAEEILDVGKSEIRELKSRMAVLLMHLIKCAYQPERHGRSWDNTIKIQRKMIVLAIEETPSLKSKTDDKFWKYVWNDALVKTEKETNLKISDLPAEMPWTEEEVLTDGWFPEAVNH